MRISTRITKGKILRFIIIFSQLILGGIVGVQSGEFVCRYCLGVKGLHWFDCNQVSVTFINQDIAGSQAINQH